MARLSALLGLNLPLPILRLPLLRGRFRRQEGEDAVVAAKDEETTGATCWESLMQGSRKGSLPQHRFVEYLSEWLLQRLGHLKNKVPVATHIIYVQASPFGHR